MDTNTNIPLTITIMAITIPVPQLNFIISLPLPPPKEGVKNQQFCICKNLHLTILFFLKRYLGPFF
jgi:hypothetical protein